MDTTADKITAAALECFFQFGYSKTSLSIIAQQAGVSRATLYNHFKNKEDIFKTAIRLFLESKVAQSKELVAQQTDYWLKLRQIIHLWVVSPFESIGNDLVINDLKHASREIDPEFYEEHRRQVHSLVNWITNDAAARGQIAPGQAGLNCMDIANATTLMISGLVEKSHQAVRQDVSIIIRSLKAMLRVET